MQQREGGSSKSWGAQQAAVSAQRHAAGCPVWGTVRDPVAQHPAGQGAVGTAETGRASELLGEWQSTGERCCRAQGLRYKVALVCR